MLLKLVKSVPYTLKPQTLWRISVRRNFSDKSDDQKKDSKKPTEQNARRDSHMSDIIHTAKCLRYVYDSMKNDSSVYDVLINNLAVSEVGRLNANGRRRVEEDRVHNLVKKLQKVCVGPYILFKFELYEWIFDTPIEMDKGPEKLLPAITEKELENIPLINPKDSTLITNLSNRFDTWNRILKYSKDQKVIDFKTDSMSSLKFTDDRMLAKYLAASYCILSSISYTKFAEQDVVFASEDEVISALKKWRVRDEYTLNAIRAVYRFSHTIEPFPPTGTRNLSNLYGHFLSEC